MAKEVESIVEPFRGRTDLMTEKNEPVPEEMQRILEQIRANEVIRKYSASVGLGSQVVTEMIRTILYNTYYSIERDGQVQVLLHAA